MVYAFLSVEPSFEKATTLLNLGASLQKVGKDVLVVDASTGQHSLSSLMGVPQNKTLLDGVRLGKNIAEGVRPMPEGFGLATLMRDARHRGVVSEADRSKLDSAINLLMKTHDVILVDAELDECDGLSTNTLNESHIVVQLSTRPESIKAAYLAIKRLGAVLGKRPFSLLFTDATERDGAIAFDNFARVATKMLAIEVTSFGFVPSDEAIGKAARMKRSVVDAFPMAASAAAFRKVAQKLVATA